MIDTIVFVLKETLGVDRHHEPLTFGVPLPEGFCPNGGSLSIRTANDSESRAFGTPLAWWKDGSIKWLLVDSQVSLGAGEEMEFSLCLDGGSGEYPPLEIQRNAGKIEVFSGRGFAAAIEMAPILKITECCVNGENLLGSETGRLILADDHGEEHLPCVKQWELETDNPLRKVVSAQGHFIFENCRSSPFSFNCRFHFFAGLPLLRMDVTLWNPKAAVHPRGVWDLGDPGSSLFRGLFLRFPLSAGRNAFLSCFPGAEGIRGKAEVSLYQDSSGGENWASRNHLNRHGDVPTRFRGFEVRQGEFIVQRGLRATPFVAVEGEKGWLAAGVANFWENFPKGLKAMDGALQVELFPAEFADLFELQGGERKTHSVYLLFGDGTCPGREILDWVHQPLIPQLPAEWYYQSRACPRPVPEKCLCEGTMYGAYQDMVDVAVHGDDSFFKRREIIDEYGWRNFGDLFADHEAVFHQGTGEFISHYNNQYDVIKGGLLQFMRSGRLEWFRLADDLARHVPDVDIYHTGEDRFEYNHGLFWHTDHHMDAATCTHRSFSCKHWELRARHLVGGGPSYAHNYGTGLLYHYWLTGAISSRESVLSLADFTVNGIRGADTLLQSGFQSARKLAGRLKRKIKRQPQAYSEVYGLDGPGRGSGNCLNVLIDAYLLTEDSEYLRWAERLIAGCISPFDDIESRNLLNAEIRWMYTIFLQALGRYLDVKCEKEQLDDLFWYARASLLDYASWMIQNEYPYLEKPEALEFPNETWSAQEIRKSDVLAHASIYAPPGMRQALLEKSRFFFDACMKQLATFETRRLTRPVVLLMTNGMVYLEASVGVSQVPEIACHEWDFGVNRKGSTFGCRVMDLAGRMGLLLGNFSLRREFHWVKSRIKNG